MVFIMKAKRVVSSVKGFALIATISVLLLLTLVAVAFLSLSAITVQTSRSEWAQEEARANARLALMVAIGELQRDLGADRRIAVEASLLDGNPDTEVIDGVQQPHWMGFVKSEFAGNASKSPFTRDEKRGGLRDARNGTDYKLKDHILNYFVSGNEGGKDRIRGQRQFIDALNDNIQTGPNAVTLVGKGSVANPDDEVIVRKMTTEKLQQLPNGSSEYRPNGAYGWWVSSNNQKAHIGRTDRHGGRRLSTTGEGIQRMLHAQDTDVSVVEGIDLGVQVQDKRILTPKSLSLLSSSNKEGVKRNFYAMTGYSASTIVNVRDGGLKKNLSAFLNDQGGSDPSDIKSLDASQVQYIGLSGADHLIGPPNSSFAALRDEEFTDSLYKDVAPTFKLLWNWARLANQFQFGETATGIRPQKIWRGAPFKNPERSTNVYDDENRKPADPRNLTDIKMTPVVVEAATYYNLATYPQGTGEKQQHVLRLCLYPRIGLWNPYNAELRLDRPMIFQLFLNGKKAVSFDGLERNFMREIYYGGRREGFDGQFGGQVHFLLPAVTIPPGETYIFSMGGAPQQLDINNFGANILQANTAPSSDSYLYKDYNSLAVLSGDDLTYATDSDPADRTALMPTPPTKFRENPQNNGRHGADNYMFMLKYLDSGAQATRSGFPNEPMLVYASVSLQAGGTDEYPLRWPTGTEAPVVQLGGPGDHIPAGVPPHPWTRDGFRVRWLQETIANEGPGGMNRQFLQTAPLGNWNLRASYILRTPYDNVTSQAPYFHGVYNRDNPSDELSWAELQPVQRDGFQTGFPFGPANFGVDSVKAFEVPTAEVGIPSIAYLRHLQLSEFVWHPSYSIGSSVADPRVETTGTMPAKDLKWDRAGFGVNYWATLFKNIVFELPNDNQLIFDMSYEVNHNLFSDYFLTGATRNQVANFAQDPIGKPLNNGNLILWDRSGDPAADLEDFFRAAGRLMIEGGFDVHSTSVEAWKALLSSTRDVGYGTLERSPFPRTLFPKGVENDRAEYSQKVFTGFRSLSDQEVESLAREIVREVKVRAPFFGLSDFVNRRLADDETGRRGALESALEDSLPNRGIDGKFPIDRTPIKSQGKLIADENPNQADTAPMFQENLPASTGYGTPGYITQGDILQVIGSTLVTRSDTFTVRAYGESTDVNGKVVARAWCEAVVMRTPEPIYPDSVTGLNPRTTSANEPDFGRRFRAISFRWLARDEV